MFDLSKTTSYVWRGHTIKCVDPGPDYLVPGSDEIEVKERHWHTKPGETVLDIGASHGSYALAALAEGARVWAWSPEGDFDILYKNVQLNGWLDRAVMKPTGLWSRAGWVRTNPRGPEFIELNLPPIAAVASYKFTNAYGLTVESPDVGPWFPVRALDTLGPSPSHLWKLDVEGAELDVLRGGATLLRRDKPRLLIENHVQYVPGIDEMVKEFLLGLEVGYVEVLRTPYNAVSHSFYEVRP